MSYDPNQLPAPGGAAPPGFDGRLRPGDRPALLIVDFVGAYLLERSPLYAPVEDARRACIELLAAARTVDVPIIHTNVRYQTGGRDGGVFFHKLPALSCWTEDADPAFSAFAPGLEPLPGEIVVTKKYASAYFGTALASTLTAARIDTVLIAGVTTSGCIRATALDTCQHGFVPLVVRDAVGDRAPGPHEANLFDLQAKYAEVVSLEFACHYLRSRVAASS